MDKAADKKFAEKKWDQLVTQLNNLVAEKKSLQAERASMSEGGQGPRLAPTHLLPANFGMRASSCMQHSECIDAFAAQHLPA